MEYLALQGGASPPPEDLVQSPDPQIQSKTRKRRPTTLSIEDQAYRDQKKQRQEEARRHPGEGSSRSKTADRADDDRSSVEVVKKPRKSNGKANESPYGMPGRGGRGGRTPGSNSRPTRGNQSSVPSRYQPSSSPMRSKWHNDDTPSTSGRLEHLTALTGPRHRQSSASQHVNPSSSAGRAIHTLDDDDDDAEDEFNLPPDRAQSSTQKKGKGVGVKPRFTMPRPHHQAEASRSQLPPSSPVVPPRSGPQHSPSAEVITFVDSDEGGDSDEENRAPPGSVPHRPSHNSSPSKGQQPPRRSSDGHAQLRSSVQPGPSTDQGWYQSRSSRGLSAEKEGLWEANGHRDGRRSRHATNEELEIQAGVNGANEQRSWSPSKLRSAAQASDGQGRPRVLSGGINANDARDEDNEEGVEDIEQFDSSQDSGRARRLQSMGKGKEKEKAPQSPQQRIPKTHAPAPRRKPMQGKDGKVPNQDMDQAPLSQRKALSPSKSSHLPSSGMATLGDVRGCFLGSMDNPLKVTRVGLFQDNLALMFRSDRVLFSLDSVVKFCMCTEADVPTIGVELFLSQAELVDLQQRSGHRLDSREVTIVFESAEDPRSQTFFSTPSQGFVGGLVQRDLLTAKFRSKDFSASDYLKQSSKARMTSKHNSSPVVPKRSLTVGPERRARSEASQLAGLAAVKRSAGQLADAKMRAIRQSMDKEAIERQSKERQTTLQQMVQQGDGALRRSSRKSTANPPRRLGDGHNPLSDEDDFAGTSSRRKSKGANVDKTKLLFHQYGLDITMGERLRLEDNDFLNDTCLEFGLRYTEDRKMPAKMREMVYCFNSFFYTKLTEKGPPKSNDDHWPAYDHVKRWTKKVDIFDKKFIIVPVNEQLHWYLAVIYNPGATIAKAKADKAAREAAGPSPTTALGALDGLESRSSRRSSRPSEGPSSDALESVSRGVGPSRTGSPSARDDADPIDILGQEDRDTAELREGVKDLHVAAPQPIQSQVYELFVAQGASPTAEPVLSKSPTPSPTQLTGRKPKGEDRDIVGSGKTWILTFDSLPGRHQGVSNCLKKWLQLEARDKRGLEIDVNDISYISGKCPTQPNFSDCGLYLIHFVERILNNSEEILHFIGRAKRSKGDQGFDEYESHMRQVWRPPHRPGDLRHHWLQTIDDQTGVYQSLHPDDKTALDQDDEDDQPLFDDAPAHSQLSIQAVSQSWPNAGNSSTSAEGALQSHATSSAIPAPDDTAVSSRGLSPAPPSASPGKEAGALTEDRKSRSTSGSDSRAPSSRSPGSKKSKIELSDDSDEEEELLEGQAYDHLYESHQQHTIAPAGLARASSHPENDVLQRPSMPSSHSKESSIDTSDDDRLCRDNRSVWEPPIINPQNQSRSSQGGEASSSLTRPILGTFPDESTDDGMDIDPTPNDPQDTPPASPSADQRQPQTTPVNPFDDLGNCRPIHSESMGGGRWGKRQPHSGVRRSSPPLSLARASPLGGSGFGLRVAYQDPHGALVPSSGSHDGREASRSPRTTAWAHADTDLHNGGQDQVATTLGHDDDDALSPERPQPVAGDVGGHVPISIDDSSVNDLATTLGSPPRRQTRASGGQRSAPTRRHGADGPATSSTSKQDAITIDDDTPFDHADVDEPTSPARRTRASTIKRSVKAQTPDSPPVRRRGRGSTGKQKGALHDSDEEAGPSMRAPRPPSTSMAVKGKGKAETTAANHERGSSTAPLEIDDTDGDRATDKDDEPARPSRSDKPRTSTGATRTKHSITHGQPSSIQTVNDSSDEDNRPKDVRPEKAPAPRSRVFARKIKEPQAADTLPSSPLPSSPPAAGQRLGRKKKTDKKENSTIPPLPLSPPRNARAGPSAKKAGSSRYALRGGRDDPVPIDSDLSDEDDDGVTETPMVPTSDRPLREAAKRHLNPSTYGRKNKRTKAKGGEDPSQSKLSWFNTGNSNEGRQGNPVTLNSE